MFSALDAVCYPPHPSACAATFPPRGRHDLSYRFVQSPGHAWPGQLFYKANGGKQAVVFLEQGEWSPVNGAARQRRSNLKEGLRGGTPRRRFASFLAGEKGGAILKSYQGCTRDWAYIREGIDSILSKSLSPTALVSTQQKNSPSSKSGGKDEVVLHFAPKKCRSSKLAKACCFLFYVIQ